MTQSYQYVGSELELFKNAKNWKRYFGAIIQNYLRGSVLEVGAGIGNNTSFLINEKITCWTALEPDRSMHVSLQERLKRIPAARARLGTLQEIAAGELFDGIVYIDVLEHIEQDREELRRAAQHLKKGGRLILLAPAHNFLFSAFDQSLGHFRRYSKKTLLELAPAQLRLEHLLHLDCLGLSLSLVNRFVLRQGLPTHSQIAFWDGLVVPFSRILDRLSGYRFGKSILGVWRKGAGQAREL